MNFFFDAWGWLSLVEIVGRTTTIEPPAHGERVAGQPYPNWTGVEWVLVAYSEPPEPDTRPAQRAALLVQLDAIDTATDKPRTRRELLLGKQATLTWLAAQDAEADALRAELSRLDQG